MNIECTTPNDGNMVQDGSVRGAKDREHGKAYFADFVLVIDTIAAGENDPIDCHIDPCIPSRRRYNRDKTVLDHSRLTDLFLFLASVT